MNKQRVSKKIILLIIQSDRSPEVNIAVADGLAPDGHQAISNCNAAQF